MTEKKAKTRTTTKKKTEEKAKSESRENRELHPADVRHEVLEMVEEHAHAMTQAVIQQAEQQGQLATVKYLFEVANILPSPKDGSEGSKEEDSLAETLLDRLHIPKVPVLRDEDDNCVVSETNDAGGLNEQKKSESPDEK